jgi:hypothetical protein
MNSEFGKNMKSRQVESFKFNSIVMDIWLGQYKSHVNSQKM